MSDEKTNNCKVKNGLLIPCEGLQTVIEDWASFSKRKGLIFVTLMNIKERKPSRSFVKIVSGHHKPKGIVVNFCPMCGANIAEHMHEKAGEESEPTTK